VALSVSLKGKFRAMVCVAAVGLLALAGFLLNSQRSGLFAERVAKTKNLVEVPYSVIVEQHRLEVEGKITREEAKRRAIEALRAMRYDGSNYFWINDMHPTMVMHPMKPELDGKDLSDLKDPKGKTVFVEFVHAARTADGGFVAYMWPKPGSNLPVPKLSFVKAFEPWGWVIGTGVYIEDIDAAWRKSVGLAGFLGVSCLVALLMVSTSVSRSIFVFRLSAEGAAGTGRSRGSQVDRAVSNSVDFSRVKMAHRSWRLKLRHFLDGHENIDRKGLASHRDCELGKWIYGGGMATYSHLQEMLELEARHKEMHASVKHVVELKHAGKAGEAEQEFSRVCEAADRVVGLITRVEAQVVGSRAHAVEGVKPRAAAQPALN
jgi:Cache domain/Chemoreceptor zinc-binding domain